jgi:hypothetical protein
MLFSDNQLTLVSAGTVSAHLPTLTGAPAWSLAATARLQACRLASMLQWTHAPVVLAAPITMLELRKQHRDQAAGDLLG